ncbi:flagellar basal body L-ring protein FlgH [Sphingomonas nostoxanthinifaciens]|uniref:flagellar basal body L-ring protein FlgH n=1 Tax=Sphingomonas nostoxanthinifaciens TaxID=2872652 RepID=UPI001CC1EC5C|nr:flagellar basal body L-ring protein FlgH [Sphingomonas nostoxanthinifaciens]UAK26061.1 flagellar basal body L-ring protein FlgH [Sphingomonas nostoxanthinifaciens]
MSSLRIALLLGLSCACVIAAIPAHAGLLGTGDKAKHDQVEYARTPYLAPPAPQADGAIFHAASGYAALTSGARAAMVGDVVTINLVEKTQAAKSNSANTNRTGSISVTPPPTGPIATVLNKVNLNMGQGATFAGKGDAAQSNQLSGAISVTIAEIYPNGTMLVRGQKQLTLNRGDETIMISGIIRAADIDFDNTVQSTRVADARITYTGKGEVARASTQGWLGRFFSRVAPF